MGRLSLEVVLLASLGLFLAGLLLATDSLALWRAASFGPLDPTRSLRLVISAVTVMLLAARTANTGMFVAVLQVPRACSATGTRA